MNIDSSTLDKIKEDIKEIISKSPVSSDPIHSEKTLKWLTELSPQIDDAMIIAALGHDIDRAVNNISDENLKSLDNYDEFRHEHSLRSVEIINKIIEKYNLNNSFIQKVDHLVEFHEVGGDPETDLLKDADSIAFFDYNIPVYLKKNGAEKTKFKLSYTFNRLVTEKAKEIIKDIKQEDKQIAELVNEAISTLNE